MSKNLVNFDEEALDEMMEQEAVARVAAKRSPKMKTPRHDMKRERTSYISAAKKGAASRAASASKAARKSPVGRKEVDDMSMLQDELCGKNYGRKNRR